MEYLGPLILLIAFLIGGFFLLRFLISKRRTVQEVKEKMGEVKEMANEKTDPLGINKV